MFERDKRLQFTEVVGYTADPQLQWLAITALEPLVSPATFSCRLQKRTPSPSYCSNRIHSEREMFDEFGNVCVVVVKERCGVVWGGPFDGKN